VSADVKATAIAQQAQIQPLKNPAHGVKTREAARSAAEEFEAVFISQMLETMFQGVKTDGPFGGGHAEGVFRSLMVKEYGQQIAKIGGIGIADNVYSEILKLQEISDVD
jgi:Rod binding domain-containing protein